MKQTLNESKSKEIPQKLKTTQIPEEKKIGTTQGVLYGVGCGIGGSIFILLGTGIETAGPGVLISLILGGILIFLTALNYSELSTSLPISGGAYNFSKEGVGGFLAFITGFFLWMANTIAVAFSAQTFGLVISIFFPILNPFIIPISILTIIFIAIVFFRTDRFAITTLIRLTTILIAIFVIFIVAGLFIAPITNPSNFDPAYLSTGSNPFAIIQMFSLLFVFFTTITSNLAYLNKDFQKPSKTIPRVNLLAIALTLIIYLSISTVVLINIGGNTEGLSQTPVLLADVLLQVLGPFGFILMGFAALISTMIAANAALSSSTSVLSALSRDKYFPDIFNKPSEKSGIPIYSLVLTVIIAIIFTTFTTIFESAEMTGFIYFFGLAFVNIAAVSLRYKRRELDRPFKAPFFPFLPILVASVCLILAFILEVAAIIMGVIIFTIALVYYLVTIAERHSIIITLAGIKFLSIIIMGVMIWLAANFSLINSTVPGLSDIFNPWLLRILIGACVFGLGTVFIDIIPTREIFYFFIKKIDKSKVAMGGIIAMEKKDAKRIFFINLAIGIVQLVFSTFIFILIVLFGTRIIVIEQISLSTLLLPHEAANYFFMACLVLLGICMSLSALISLYLNRELRDIGI